MSLPAVAAAASPAPAPAPAPAPTIKLLIDKKAKRVLFAEARKDAVDFLFGLLAMPLGFVAKVHASDSDGAALGAVANIYASVEKMDPTYMQTKAVRDALLSTYARRQGASGSGGFVQGLVTYTIMDDLTITPMSNISGMALLSKLIEGEKALVLEEKSVKIGCQEGLDIIKASLHSKTVLTDVFLSNKKRAPTSSDRNDVVEKEKDKIPDFYV